MIEKENFYVSTVVRIECYILSHLFKNWTLDAYPNEKFGKIMVKGNELCAIDRQNGGLTKIKIGKINKRTKKVKSQISISTSKSLEKIIDLSFGKNNIIALNEDGCIQILDTNLNPDCDNHHPGFFKVQRAKDITMEENKLYILTSNGIKTFVLHNH